MRSRTNWSEDKENGLYIPANLPGGILKKLCFRGNTAEKEENWAVGIVDKHVIHLIIVIQQSAFHLADFLIAF